MRLKKAITRHGLSIVGAVEPVTHDRIVVWAATYLPVRSHRGAHALRVLSGKIAGSLSEADGLVRFGLLARPWSRKHWTVSAWRDETSMRAWLTTPLHAEAMEQFQDWRAPGAAFVDWCGEDAPVDWATVMSRLAAG